MRMNFVEKLYQPIGRNYMDLVASGIYKIFALYSDHLFSLLIWMKLREIFSTSPQKLDATTYVKIFSLTLSLADCSVGNWHSHHCQMNDSHLDNFHDSNFHQLGYSNQNYSVDFDFDWELDFDLQMAEDLLDAWNYSLGSNLLMYLFLCCLLIDMFDVVLVVVLEIWINK